MVSDLELLGVDLPLGYGESLSNRDAGTTLIGGDRLVLRLDGDASQADQDRIRNHPLLAGVSGVPTNRGRRGHFGLACEGGAKNGGGSN